MDDLLNEFLAEMSEGISVLDAELVKFEQDPNDAAILKDIFRLVHTIKGTSCFLGLPRLESVAHAVEDVLGKFRDGELEVTPNAVALILKAIDAIKGLLTALEDGETEPNGDDSALIAELEALVAGDGDSSAEAAPAPPEGEGIEAPVSEEDGFPVARELLDEVEGATAAGKKAAIDEELAAELAVENEAMSVPAAAQSIRVSVELLENLMTLVSDLVLTRNQLLQMVRGRDDSEFHVPLHRLSHITTDLREGVMKMRMQPIGNAWAKLPRIVRDLSVEAGKKIDLNMQGAETELDRQVLELIKEPLIHMVRNSAVHSVEMPDERKAAGKAEKGVVTLKAFHEGGHIIIEIADDGRGLNMDRIRMKVLDNGLATDGELEGMDDQQIQQYIFKAGFSTAEKVTSDSGRGVGMDVVRTNIDKIGGTIELKSIEGQGSTFTIKIPFTLPIVSALVIECGGERFAIPQISVLELVRASAQSDNVIEMINDAPVLRLRNRLLPLVSLYDVLKLGEKKEGLADELFIVVAQVGTYTFGIIVDQVFDTEEIVVKPVTPILKDISFYLGNTILGDGSVIMILDPNGIASTTGEVTGAKGADAGVQAQELGEQKTSLLVFRAGGDALKAVPLGLVARLEEIDMSTVERANGQFLVQYRGHLMPLVPFNPSHQWKTEGRQQILVFTDRDRSMGLAVDEIVDTVEEILVIELKSEQPGVIGSAVIDDKVTDVIDAGHYLTQGFADWFGTKKASGDNGVATKRVLLVDDSLFFRDLLRPVLSVAGYEVTTAETADEALGMREAGQRFDAIVSDIEMPGMNGFEFAEAVRGDARWQQVPMVALSSHASEKDIERGQVAGFGGYVAKFDRDALVSTLTRIIGSTVMEPAEPLD
jgi:two-component system, chemotaxis family, sensor kinase CheA